MHSNAKPVATSDYDAVITAARRYTDGYRAGSFQDIQNAFHADAVMYGYSDGKLLSGPAVAQFADFFAVYGASAGAVSRLDVLAITPSAAVVRVDMENDVVGASYNDYLSLLKVDGEWKIISKVFHRFDN